jgi:outer membrane usher protein
VNERLLGELNILFKHLDDSNSAVLCVDPILLTKLDLQDDYLRQIQKKIV